MTTTSQSKSRATLVKPSAYNHFVRSDSGSYWGYNFLYRSIISIPEELFPLVKELLSGTETVSAAAISSPAAKEWLHVLEESSFIIGDDTDEFSLIKYWYHRSVYYPNALSLTIMPTLDCNLRCPYCYEFKKPVHMTEEIEERLLDWVESQFGNKKKITVLWFGGEPLMRRQTMHRVTERLQAFSSRIGATYASTLTTNGTLLTSEFLASIPKLAIRAVQITFDGGREDHDKLRFKRNGDGTFDELVERAAEFCDVVPPEQCELYIRVNCCDDNAARMRSLLCALPAKVKERVTIFFRWIYSNKASGDRVFSRDMGAGTVFANMGELCTLARSLGWNVRDPFEKRPFAYCEVDQLDQYVVFPDGRIAFCNHFQGASEAAGDLMDPNNLSRLRRASSRWFAVDPFSDEKCVDCKMLPFCVGGCRKTRFEGRPDCMQSDSAMDYFVRSIVEYRLQATARASRSETPRGASELTAR